MIRKQQQLRDRTFRQGQDQRRERQRGQRGQQGNRTDGRPAAGPAGAERPAQQVAGAVEAARHGPARRKGRARARARKARAKATRWANSAAPAKPWATPKAQLGEGDADGAVDCRAARSRRCARARRAWRSRCSRSGQGQQGPGPGQPGRNGQPRAKQDTDPLGRPLRGREYGDDTTVKVPGEIDVQRARRILEELRKRFGESLRPQLELDYIERLLKDF